MTDGSHEDSVPGDESGAGGDARPSIANRNRNIAIAVVGAIVIAVIVAVATGSGDDSDSSATFDDVAPLVHVVYELDGTASSADITIQTDSGGTSQQQGVDVPLRNKAGGEGLRFTFDGGEFVYISAQNNGSGTLTCRIKADGVVISENTASGEFAIATCEGTA